jgi:hypothetical protein
MKAKLDTLYSLVAKIAESPFHPMEASQSSTHFLIFFNRYFHPFLSQLREENNVDYCLYPPYSNFVSDAFNSTFLTKKFKWPSILWVEYLIGVKKEALSELLCKCQRHLYFVMQFFYQDNIFNIMPSMLTVIGIHQQV